MHDHLALPLAREKASNEAHLNVTVPRRKLIGFRDVAILIALPFIIYGIQSRSNRVTDMVSHRFNWNSSERYDKHGHGRRPPFGKAAEEIFLSVPDESSAMKASRQYGSKPHMAGTPGDFDTAVDFLRLLQSELGIPAPSTDPIFAAGSPESQDATLSIGRTRGPRAWIDTYYPVMNTPLDRSIQIVSENGTVLWTADLKEYSDLTDPEAAQYADDVPTFHGLSHDGDVTGHVVDGNYCTKEDYDWLVQQKAPLKGSVVLCRYGGIFRGLKIKGGQEVGAVGVLIYSDPHDDGTVTIENGYKEYPHGPARNPTSVQRGSVQFLSIYPGDPTTPGYPAYENSTRTEGSNIPSIPSIPISWANAKKLLGLLAAPSDRKVRIVNHVDTRVIPIWNTMGVIPGHIKDEVIVIGNHRDAWVLGATDPTSGTVSVHEVIRGFGHLLRKGWKPLRTILIASWDAEEYGLIGSTEWGEDFPDWIIDHVVAYLNLDSSVSGSRLRYSGSPLLAHFLRETAQEISHPTDKKRTLWDANYDDGSLLGLYLNESNAANAFPKHEINYAAADDVGVSPLGSGSDYTVFLQRAGIPSTNGGFGATVHDPVYHYHSVFDSVRWQEIYGDPGFFRHVAISKHLGLLALRLSNALTFPFNTTHYAHELESYLNNVERIAISNSFNSHFNTLRASIHSLQAASVELDAEKLAAEKELKTVIQKWNKQHRRLGRKMKKIYCRLKKLFGKPCQSAYTETAEKELIPSWLQEKRDKENDILYSIAHHAGFAGPRSVFDRNMHSKPGFPIYELKRAIKRVQAVNKKLVTFERGFISSKGIKDREWFKHLGVAPGKWLGYGATTLPGVTEALVFDKDSAMAQQEAKRVEELVNRLTNSIRLKDES